MKLEHPQSVQEVQHRLDQWLESYYHDKIHSSTSKTPREAFQRDRKMQRFVSREELNLEFTLTEQRLVDKTGCISFRSRKFEAGVDVIGFRVSVAYSADNPDELMMYHPATEPRVIHPLVIAEHVRPAPVVRPLVEVGHSRMLRAIEKKHERQRGGATSFTDLLHKQDGDA